LKITLKIFRFNPETDKDPHYDNFTIEADPNDRILDCLNKIRWEQDSSLSYRMSCAHGVCGSDAVTINGSPALACQKLVKDYNYSEELLVEPLKYFPLIKDLNVDMRLFFKRVNGTNPKNSQDKLLNTDIEKERVQTIEERENIDDAIKCILCGCCVAACPVELEQDQKFIGPAAILRAQRHIFDSRITNKTERMQLLDKLHGIWGCKSYYMCTLVCPKNIKVTEAILKTKKKIIRDLHPQNNQETS
jgi:succinate dehydrogenase / fumarate reductase, iron-sulfur subunit